MIKKKKSSIDRLNFLVRNSPRNVHMNGHVFGVGTSSYPTQLKSKRIMQAIRPSINKVPKFNYSNAFNEIGYSLYPGKKLKPHYNLAGSSLWIPQQSNVSIFSPINSKPAAAFWGDNDKDGFYNGFDCRPNNSSEHGWISSAASAIGKAASSGVSKVASTVSSGVSKVASAVTGKVTAPSSNVATKAPTSSSSSSSRSSGGGSFGVSTPSPFTSSTGSSNLPQSVASDGELTKASKTPVIVANVPPVRKPIDNIQPVHYHDNVSRPVSVAGSVTSVANTVASIGPTTSSSMGPTISPQTSQINVASPAIQMAARPRTITAPIAQQRINTERPIPNMANPASVYARSLGYKLEIRTDSNGNQYGMAIRPDGTEIEEWALFRQRPTSVNTSELKYNNPKRRLIINNYKRR